MRNADLDVAVAELDAVGVRDYVVARGGKHLQLRWIVNGQPRMLTVPLTASDWRSPKNTRSDLRKILRADGLLPKTNGNAHPATPPSDWRRRIIELTRALIQVNIPAEYAVERAAVIAALHKLIKGNEP
jgi:hypothetical protein